MNIVVLILVILLLYGGLGYRFNSPAYWGSGGVGVVIVVLLILLLLGAIR